MKIKDNMFLRKIYSDYAWILCKIFGHREIEIKIGQDYGYHCVWCVRKRRASNICYLNR